MKQLLITTALALALAAPAAAQMGGQGHTAQQTARSGMETAQRSETPRLISAEQLIQRDVVSAEGRHVGSIDYIVIEPVTGAISSLLVRADGLRRAGQQGQGGQQAPQQGADLLPIPWHAVDISAAAEDEVHVQVPLRSLRQLPTISENQLQRATSPRLQARLVEVFGPAEPQVGMGAQQRGGQQMGQQMQMHRNQDRPMQEQMREHMQDRMQQGQRMGDQAGRMGMQGQAQAQARAQDRQAEPIPPAWERQRQQQQQAQQNQQQPRMGGMMQQDRQQMGAQDRQRAGGQMGAQERQQAGGQMGMQERQQAGGQMGMQDRQQAGGQMGMQDRQGAGGQMGMQDRQQAGGQMGAQERQQMAGAEPHILLGRGIVGVLQPPAVATAAQMRGLRVTTDDGREIGEVNTVMINTDRGIVDYVLVLQDRERTGFVPVAFRDLSLAADGQSFTLDRAALTIGMASASPALQQGTRQQERFGQQERTGQQERFGQQDRLGQQQTQQDRSAARGQWQEPRLEASPQQPQRLGAGNPDDWETEEFGPEAGEVEQMALGVVERIDRDNRRLVLEDGSNFRLADDVELDDISSGDEVALSYSVRDQDYVVSEVRSAPAQDARQDRDRQEDAFGSGRQARPDQQEQNRSRTNEQNRGRPD